MSKPQPPLEVEAPPGEVVERLGGPRVAVPDDVIERLRGACSEVLVDEASRIEASRDWWPLAIGWATVGQVPALPAVVARPSTEDEVSALLAICHEARVPVTPAAGRSGVCGGSIPAFGGVTLDMCAMAGITDIDHASVLAEVLPGTFGPDLERALREEDLTLGHWPQSMDLSTVGGWLACRGAGQYSTRYGKIEDMTAGLRVVLADGRIVRTGGAGPRSALGPDLTQMFVGSEGTLGVITSATLRLRPVPPAQSRQSWSFPDFATGLEACRRILRDGATPAVLRLYDEVESTRHFGEGTGCALVVLDEAEGSLLEATMSITSSICEKSGAARLGEEVVDKWVENRNDVSALAPLYRAGVVVDTMEISARWASLPRIYRECVDALGAIEGTVVASAHQSHAYSDGACLYFTFAGRPPEAGGERPGPSAIWDGGTNSWAERYYRSAWEATMTAVADAGGAISHHHGVGLNRARFMNRAPGTDIEILESIKTALDPRGILNPGKLGLGSGYGEVGWP